jgi:hypothetical protein
VYAGSGDGDYLPERQIFGQAIIAVKQNAETKALEMTDWYAPSNAYWLRKRDLDINATGPVFEFKGKEYTAHTSKECRVWLLDTSRPWRGGSPDAGLQDAADLQRGSAVRRRGRVGRAGDVGRIERHALDPRAIWGPKHSAFTAPIEHGQVVQGAVAAFKLEEKGAHCSSRQPGCRAICGRPIRS